MKKLFLLTLSLIGASHLHGQSFNPYSYNLYHTDLKLVNPSFTGNENGEVFNIIYLEEWRDAEFSPRSIFASFENNFEKTGTSIGFALNSISSQIITMSKFSALIAQQIKISENQFLKIGVNVNYSLIDYDFGSLGYSYNPFFGFDDPPLPVQTPIDPSIKNYNLDFGIGYKNGNLLIGISVNDIFDVDSFAERTVSQQLYSGFGSYEYQLTSKIKIKPSILYTYFKPFESSSTDLNLGFELFNVLELGYRSRFFDSEQFSIFYAGIEYTNWIQMNVVFYDQQVHRSKFPSQIGNNLELSLQLNLGDL